MSGSYDNDSKSPRMVILPSADRQVSLMYDRLDEEYPESLSEPDYHVSDAGRISQVQKLLDGEVGFKEVRHYSSEDYEIVLQEEDVDIGRYLEQNIHESPEKGQNRFVVEEVASFELELPEDGWFTGYVLTGREQAEKSLPKPLLGEIKFFSNPRKDSEIIVKTQEPATL